MGEESRFAVVLFPKSYIDDFAWGGGLEPCLDDLSLSYNEFAR